ncbi:hypothetical protein SOCEGT47_057980 [Sorangium cellulosum]|uniref:Secreted protein n=1 Tax=Sorangium cellulosum TaxID=56 RepID=A0A4P2Q6X6_SORCE|nr:hypothetical protein [Sorangium cellulosum]AUX25254.1 hypothetical protein SOCEGT47_057980 [Sorangium cellulosum]
MRRAALVPPLAAALLLAPACAPAPAAPPPPPPRSAPPPPPPDLGDGQLGEYRSERFDLRLPLPDARGFRVEDGQGPWLVATHAASSTSLLVRTWREDGRASRAACEARARLWRDLPRPDPSLTAVERRVDAPEGFDTVVQIGVVEAPPGAPIQGFALAFGGSGRRCVAFVAGTRAQGASAERLVAERLAAVVEISLGGLRLEREVAPAVPREPVP